MPHIERRSRPETRESRPARDSGRLPQIPNLASIGWDVDSTIARESEVWAAAIVRSVAAWRHRERRRREGHGGRP
jgi:hypothetical protein